MKQIATFAAAHWGTIVAVALAVLGFFGKLWSAFTGSLPNPDDPSDWYTIDPDTKAQTPIRPKFIAYRIFYKTVRLFNNQKPQPIVVPPVQTQEVLPPK